MNEFYECKVDCTVNGRSGRAVSVKWLCELEEREWGYKSIVIHFPAQYITVAFEQEDPFSADDEVEYFIDEYEVKGSNEIPLRLGEIEIKGQKLVAYF